MAYTFDYLFAADPSNPANIARAASIVIHEIGDATLTPVALTTVDGQAYPNPVTTNANGFAPQPVHETLDRLAWTGGGMTGTMTSFEGMKEEAVAARAAAETAAATAGADAAAVADAAIGDATAEAEAAAASAAAAEAAAASSATAAANSAALVNAPADTAIAAAINGTGTATKTALSATYALKSEAGAANGYDVIVAFGQSNTAGRGTPYNATTDPSHPLIFQYGAKGRAIVAATEPLDNNETSTSGIGPAFQFARHYIANGINAGRKVLIVPAAKGGTKLVGTTGDTWNSTVGGNLYAQMVTQTQEALTAAGTGSKIVGFIWVQGESDGDDNRSSAEYRTALDALITKTRADLNAPTVPFIIGGMVPAYLGTGTRTAINGVHKDTPFRKPWTTFVAPPSGAEYHLGDGNHFNAAGQRLIGKNMFDAWKRAYVGLSSVDAVAAPGFTDSFNRADTSGTSLGVTDGGLAWENLDTGSWRILTNQARTTVGDPSYGGDTYTVVNAGAADGTLETVMTAGNRAGGVALRVQDRTNMLYLAFRANSSNFTLTLYKWVAGVKSTVSTSTTTLGYGEVLTVDLAGSSVIVKVNGVAAITATATDFQTATKFGLYGNTAGTDVRWDYLKFTAA